MLGSDGVVRGRGLASYAGAVSLGFALLYVLTRSSILIGDGASFISVTRAGDPAHIHYGEPGHFLQCPLARAVWRMLDAPAMPIPLETVFLGISLLGTVIAIVCVGLIAAELLHTPSAAWLAAVLYGTSLHSWTQWNGELYGLALGFVAAGLFLALRGWVVVPAVLWAFSVLSHSEFVMAAPAFVVTVWMAQRSDMTTLAKLRKASLLMAIAAASTLVVMLLGSWALGKWSDATSLVEWLARSYRARQQDVAAIPQVGRAIKGLLTAYTVAGHYWRDILTGRGQFGNPLFLPFAAAGLLVLVCTGTLVIAAARRRSFFFSVLAWLLPFHILVNWWFVPTVEKYHAGALPGLVLLVTGGLVAVGTRMPPRRRFLLFGGYAVGCAALNLLGAVLPMQALGRDTRRAESELRELADRRQGRAVFIACDNSKVIVGAHVTYLRLRSIWTGTVPEIQQRVISWTEDRLREGKEPYLVGRWCLPEEWKTTSSKQPFDLFFLGSRFTMTPSGIAGVPISETVPTNPFNWTKGDVLRLESH
jgi:hypothetical protein